MGTNEYRLRPGRLLRAISPAHIKKGYRYLKRHGVRQFAVRLTERFLPEEVSYPEWFSRHRATEETLERQRKEAMGAPVLFSLAVSVYDGTKEPFFRALLDAVRAQTYGNWELCVADASTKDANGAGRLSWLLAEYQERDARIRVRQLPKNGGFSGNQNEALAMAEGEFVGFLDHDDLLEPDALYEVAACIAKNAQTDMVYTDEDKVNRKGTKFATPNFKPDFNLDLLRSNNYICHFLVVRASLARAVGGFHAEFDGAQDYDFILRCAEQARAIGHVPRVLYHWRTHDGSTSDNPDSKLYAFDAGQRAVEAHLRRVGVRASVSKTRDLGYYRVHYPVQGHPMVSILIPTRDELQTLKTCLSSIWEQTEYDNYEILVAENNSANPETFAFYREIDGKHHVRVLYWKNKEFNFSAVNNFAAKQAKGEYLLFLNNDTKVLTKGWMKELLGTCQREEIGMVGAKLYFPDNTVQSAGTIIGLGGLADHAFVNMPRRQSGYMHRASIQQNLSGVTAACAMAKRRVFEEVGGFEEQLAVAFNDVDLGLKIVTAGYLIAYDPYVELYHYESKSRGQSDEKRERHKAEVLYAQKKWADFLEKGDPCYNCNLTLARHNFSLRT